MLPNECGQSWPTQARLVTFERQAEIALKLKEATEYPRVCILDRGRRLPYKRASSLLPPA
jgi:hypothetical protein